MELFPESPFQVLDAIQGALAEKHLLAIEGQGSKRDWGRPVAGDVRVSLRRSSGIIAYEPDELVLTALAGTPIAEIEAALAERRQHLAFEPPDLAPLWGGAKGAGTLGGVLACNLSGPSRPKAGAARDHFLGFKAVNGLGQEFKSGGRVVKNVTGYDLSKLMAGSFGTLAILTEVTVKVLPAPEKQRTALFGFDTLGGAHRFLVQALLGEFEMDGAAILPAAPQARIAIDRLLGLGPFLVACRMSGTGASVEARCSSLRASGITAGEELHSMNSRLLWAAIRDVSALLPDNARQIWRLSVPPSDGETVVAKVLDAFPQAEWLMDWGGGLIWLSVPDTNGDSASLVRGAIAPGRGHATLLRGPAALRAAIDPMPIEPGSGDLLRRVKHSFDPHGLLNPGRLYRDW